MSSLGTPQSGVPTIDYSPITRDASSQPLSYLRAGALLTLNLLAVNHHARRDLLPAPAGSYTRRTPETGQ